MMTDIQALIEARRRTHGDFADVARVAQGLKALMREAPSWPRMSDVQRESVEAICGKLARLTCGDPGFHDHAVDIQGYARLVEETRP